MSGRRCGRSRIGRTAALYAGYAKVLGTHAEPMRWIRDESVRRFVPAVGMGESETSPEASFSRL